MALAVLLRPAGIHVFLRPLGGLVGPVLGHLAVLDGLVFLARVVIARHRHDGRIEDLPAPRDIALARQIAVELAEQLLDQTRLRQPLAIEPDRLGVRHPVLETQPQKPHERKPVPHLVFDLVVRQVVERAQDQRLEHQNGVHRLAPGARFARLIRLAPHPLEVGRNSSHGTTASISTSGSRFASRLAYGLKDQRNPSAPSSYPHAGLLPRSYRSAGFRTIFTPLIYIASDGWGQLNQPWHLGNALTSIVLHLTIGRRAVLARVA